MIEQFFDEYNISESELKNKIYKTLCELCRLQPEKWSSEALELVTPDQPPLQILKILLKASPEQIENELNSKRVTVLDLLRIASFSADTFLNDIHLKKLLIEQNHRRSINHICKSIYTIICSILVEKQENELNFDRNLVYDLLDRNGDNLLQVIETLEAMSFAMRLIKAFYSDEKNKLFVEQINSFTKSVDRYVEENCLSNALFSIGALFEEAHIKYINEIDLSEPLSKENKSELINRLRKFNNKISSKRLEIQRGGARKREGFVWTDEYKIKFYETVENLPKIGNKPMWEYALNELMEKDFDFYIKEYLTTRTPFKSVPRKLFNPSCQLWSLIFEIRKVLF